MIERTDIWYLTPFSVNPNFSHSHFWNRGEVGQTFLFQPVPRFSDQWIRIERSSRRLGSHACSDKWPQIPDPLGLSEHGATPILWSAPSVTWPGTINHRLQVIQHTRHKLNIRSIHHRTCPPDSVSSILRSYTCDAIMVIVGWNRGSTKALLTDSQYCILLSTGDI